MRVAFIASPYAYHQTGTVAKLTNALKMVGDEFVVFGSHPQADMEVHHGNVDAICCWGWRRGREWFAKGYDVLVMERAYLDNRFVWTSLGWNGLNGRARWPIPVDGGARWR
jgi:hypothetical protein